MIKYWTLNQNFSKLYRNEQIMKDLRFYIPLLFFPLLLLACTSQREILPGAYIEYAGNNRLLLQQEEIVLYPDRNQTFEYRSYTDTGEDEKYGSGNYKQTGKNLVLRFRDTTTPRSFIEILKRNEDSPELIYNFKVVNVKTGASISGVHVYLLDAEKNKLVETTTSFQGTATIDCSKTSAPKYFQIANGVYDPVIEPIEKGSKTIQAYMAPKYEAIIRPGTVLKYEILNIDDDQLKLKIDDTEKHFALEASQ